MTKSEFKSFKTGVNIKMKALKTEIKALQSAIDRGLSGDTAMVSQKFGELKGFLKELKNVHH